MATTLSLFLQRLHAVLQAAVPPGTRVYRGRADAESRAEAPSVNVRIGTHPVEPVSDDMDVHTVSLELQLAVRSADALLASEALHEAVHGAVMTDPELRALVASIRLTDSDGEPEQADETSLVTTARYRLVYMQPKTLL